MDYVYHVLARLTPCIYIFIHIVKTFTMSIIVQQLNDIQYQLEFTILNHKLKDLSSLII